MFISSTEVGLWVDLLREGQARAHMDLSEATEAYTVHLLQRYLVSPWLIDVNLALGYLQSQAQSGALKHASLHRTADAGLLLAGLFPSQSRARHVTPSYFTGMSRACFLDLANLCDSMRRPTEAKKYRDMALNVEPVVCVLNCVRRNTRTVHEILNLNPKE